jgi:D-alanyl-D-alanine carboxypeptidase
MTGWLIAGAVLLLLLLLLLLGLMYRSDRRAKRAGHAMRSGWDMMLDATRPSTIRSIAPARGPDMSHRHAPGPGAEIPWQAQPPPRNSRVISSGLPNAARRRRGAVAVALLLLLGAGCTGGNAGRSTPVASTSAPRTSEFPAFPDQALPAAQAAKLQQELNATVVSRIAPGVTAAVVSPAGTWTGAAGVAGNGARLTPRAAMAIASITKTFSAAEVMQLVERGKIDLDARLSAYVRLSIPDNGATVRDALRMRSGIPSFDDSPDLGRLAAATPPDAYVSWDQVLDSISKKVSEPDRAFAYSDPNYIVLGKIIEKVTGRSFAQNVRVDLLSKAHLDRVFVQDEERATAPLATPARALAGEGIYLPNRKLASALGGAGCIAADAASLARWGYELFGGHVLSRGSLAAMLPEAGADYGYGVDHRSLLNSEANVAGHAGVVDGFRTQLWVDLEHQISVVVLMATDHDADPSSVADNILANLLNR